MSRVEVPPFHNPLERLDHVVKAIPPWVRHWKSLSLVAAAAVVGGSYMWITHDRGPQNPPIQPTTSVSDTFNPANPDLDLGIVIIPATPISTPEMPYRIYIPRVEKEDEPTATPFPIETPQPTATSTPTPEAKKDEPCIILPEKYCSQAELVESIDAKGESGLVIGLKLPPGVPIRSPIDGEVSKAKTKYGYLGVINDPTDPTVLAIGIQGHIEFKNMFTVKAKKGDVIGYTQDWDEEQFLPSPLGNYTLGISSTRRQDGKIIDNPDKLRDLFPRAFKGGPVKRVKISGSGTGTIYLSPRFVNSN